MDLSYTTDERPGAAELLIQGLQWFAVAFPSVVIIGKVVAGVHFNGAAEQTLYLQKTAFIMGATIIFQIFSGHRMAIISGPSSILLIGVLASTGSDMNSVYSAIIAGGLMLFLSGAAGLFSLLKRLFTRQVVAVVLLLIAFTLSPAIMDLIIGDAADSNPLADIIFSLIMVSAMFCAQRLFTGFLRSTLIIWFMITGSIIYSLIFPARVIAHTDAAAVSHFFSGMLPEFSFDPGVMISFFFCFLALSVNDVGSVQSMNELLGMDEQEKRVNRGLLVTGCANILSGCMGVIGPVSFSLSPGVIASSRCASRYAVAPAGFLLILMSFSPALTGLAAAVPRVIIGCVLLFVMTAQVSAGLSVAFEEKVRFSYERGLVIGFPLIAGTIISFLPDQVVMSFPRIIRPLLGNGFVVGVVLAIVMEHVVFRGHGKVS